jgi:hypothetical protein
MAFIFNGSSALLICINSLLAFSANKLDLSEFKACTDFYFLVSNALISLRRKFNAVFKFGFSLA